MSDAAERASENFWRGFTGGALKVCPYVNMPDLPTIIRTEYAATEREARLGRELAELIEASAEYMLHWKREPRLGPIVAKARELLGKEQSNVTE